MVDKIKNLINDPIEKEGYILSNVEYVKEGSLNYLRVFIDKSGFINVDDCVKVTKLINPILDKEDPISESYILEVSSQEKGDVNE